MSFSCLSWNTSIARFHPPMLAIGSDDQSATGSKVFVYEYNETSRRWLRIDAFTAMTDLVNDISFAPNLGRSYHVLAVASKELKILALKPLSGPNLTIQPSATKRTEDQQSTATKFDVSTLKYRKNPIFISKPSPSLLFRHKDLSLLFK